MTKSVYKKILWFGIALILVFSPLARGGIALWAITPVQAIVACLVFAWLWRFNNEKKRFIRTRLDLPLVLFFILAVVSFVISDYKYASALEAARLLTIGGIFYLGVNNFRRSMSLKIVTLVIAVAAGASLFGLAQYFLGLQHSWWRPARFLAATYVNHNHFAGYLELATPLAIGLFFGIRRDDVSSDFKFKSYKLGLAISLVVMILALIFSQSRGAWISLLASLLVMNIVLIKRKVLKKQSLIFFFLIFILLAAFIIGGYDSVAKRAESLEDVREENALNFRMKIWQGTASMIKDNFLTGTGIGTFVWRFPAYRPTRMRTRTYYAHNEYLHMMAEMGVLALPVMLWIIAIVIGSGLRIRRDSRLTEGMVLGAAIGILSLALHGLIDFNFHIPANMIVVSCLAGIIMRRSARSGI